MRKSNNKKNEEQDSLQVSHATNQVTVTFEPKQQLCKTRLIAAQATEKEISHETNEWSWVIDGESMVFMSS